MLFIKGIYDGEKIKPLEDIPIKEKCDVMITFINKTETDHKSDIDPIKALRGCSKGKNLTKKLLESRREDLELEEAKFRRRK
ncbi:MAG: hypothetical protein QG641_2466 [Candidatus Poribacteria bacterium]|nr:hypothetical protein [Candidatus Poribacteria bacterium]